MNQVVQKKLWEASSTKFKFRNFDSSHNFKPSSFHCLNRRSADANYGPTDDQPPPRFRASHRRERHRRDRISGKKEHL